MQKLSWRSLLGFEVQTANIANLAVTAPKVTSLFGAAVDCSAAADHDNELAATDGLVDFSFTLGADGHVQGDGYTDNNNPPTTHWKRGQGEHGSCLGAPFTMRVRKGERWKVVIADSGTVNWWIFWTPIGS